ncbi:MAG TPA: DUF4331 domain-containing protein [Candidatus Acidoferrales bacterium]|nr:DUF4331 domain-containing protein [Candidatus Acidoferrales bacterium]
MRQIAKGLLAASLTMAAAFAASHRNGPLLLEDQTANLNDFYIFRSYETGKSDRLVMSMSAQGFQNPDNGPSYYKFSPSVLYRFNINNSRGLDGAPDLQIDFQFQDTYRTNPTFVSYFGKISTIDSPGILLYETYVVILRDLKLNKIIAVYDKDVKGHALSVAPPNLGPNTTPAYETNLGAPSVFTLANGMRVFAGPRDDAFFFDSAATFDTLNFRAPAPVLSGSADQGQGAAAPAAVDGFAGYNISLIAVEVPITMVTASGTVPTSATDPNAKIGAWASTLRQIVTVRPSPSDPISYGDWMQVDRVGNPLTVEALIPLPLKDRWNRSLPVDDKQWAPYIGDPFFASGVLNGVFSLKVPPAPRTDLLGVYVPDITRVDLTIAPTPIASQNRLGPLGGDNAGWPFGGRRPIDDVVDIGFRALAGVLVPGFTNAPPLGDGVNSNDVPLLDHFPFHAAPHAGFTHSQINGTNGRGTATGN